LADLVEASKRAYWGSSGFAAAANGGAELKVGAACERYCWFNGRESKAPEAGGGAGGAEYAEGLYRLVALHALVFGSPGGTAASAAFEAAACDFGAAAATAHDTEDDGEDDQGANNDSDNDGPPVDALATVVTLYSVVTGTHLQ
jgi:hypothetical protein